MVRLLEFDEDEALTKAMHIFRSLGYSGVSIKTLEKATGLSSGSLYNSFGGKDAVFKRALRHYNNTVVDKRIKEHLLGKSALDGLNSLFESLLDEPDGQAHGCLLTNSAIEFAGSDNIAHEELKHGFNRFQTAFEEALIQIPNMKNKDVAQLSLRLLTYYQGLLVLIRHGSDKAALRPTINAEIKSILGVKDA